MRILLGGLTHEANTFSPHAADLTDFDSRQLLRGNEILAGWQSTRTEQAGALSVFESDESCSVVPTFLARGISGGPIVSNVYRLLLEELVASIEAALPADGILLVLHGAMMAENEPDATGEILARVRQAAGPDMPIVGTLDLHANVTKRMVEEATALVGYQTAPHVDMHETGQKAAQVLLKIVAGSLQPTSALIRLPMLLPPENSTHMWGPLAEVIAMVHKMEADGEIVHGSVYPVQPWMDTEDMAASVLVVTDDDLASAQRHAQRAAERFWALRHEFHVQLVPPTAAVEQALRREGGTVILCDSADSTTSGSTGDSTDILSAVLAVNETEHRVLLNVVDPEVVEQALGAGISATIEVMVGGKAAPQYFAQVAFRGYVKTISDGVFTFKGPGMHGVPHQMGRTVVLVKDNIHLVVMERPVSQWDPQLYRSLGEEPSDARIVQVKSPMAFRAGYEGIYDDIIIVATNGAANPDLVNLPWQKLPRPIYPLDPDTVWP